MQIWVDADACPVVIKDIIFRAATRTETNATLVANQYIKIPSSPFIKIIQVHAGFDVADNEIIKHVQDGDLVITSDIPLADGVITKGAKALSPRGELFTHDNIKSRLSIRDFMETLRNSGIQTGGPNTLSQNDRKAFAAHLDKWLVQKQQNN